MSTSDLTLLNPHAPEIDLSWELYALAILRITQREAPEWMRARPIEGDVNEPAVVERVVHAGPFAYLGPGLLEGFESGRLARAKRIIDELGVNRSERDLDADARARVLRASVDVPEFWAMLEDAVRNHPENERLQEFSGMLVPLRDTVPGLTWDPPEEPIPVADDFDQRGINSLSPGPGPMPGQKAVGYGPAGPIYI